MSVTTHVNGGSDTISHYVGLAKQGDKAAFKTLLAKVSNTVSSIALAITKDVQDSEDVCQLVFIKMWQQLDQLNNNDSLLPWVRQITRYTAFNFIRDKKSYRQENQDDEALESLLETLSENEQHDTALIKEQQNRLIRHLLDTLPDESKEIVLLYYREDSNSRVVAELLELNETTVRKRLQRARETIKSSVLAKYGKVILATAPVGLVSVFATTAMTASPVAASTLTYSAVSKNSHWLSKLLASLGGAAIGGVIAIIANSFAINKVLKHIDNQADIETLKRIKWRSNILIAITSLIFGLSYIYSQGWLFPVLTYALFIAGLAVNVTATNRISIENLQRQASSDPQAAKKVKSTRLWCVVGWVIGGGGGTLGLLYGLYMSGRFSQLL
ncbi:RNA polymerase sigma factor [Thalassotalea ganghwensis]